jgi:hypothetical protein
MRILKCWTLRTLAALSLLVAILWSFSYLVPNKFEGGTVELFPGYIGVYDHSRPRDEFVIGPVSRKNTSWGGSAVFIRFWCFALPLWGIVTLWVLPQVTRAMRGRWRFGNGLCPTCGYDLRATLDRCPECGVPTE